MKKSGMLIVNVSILIMLTLLMVGGKAATDMYISYEVKMAKEECDVLNRAISSYAKYHKSIDTDNIYWDNEKNEIVYNQRRAYPKDMDELEELQKAGYLTQDIDLSKYSYTASDDLSEYTLEVVLPNDEKYTCTETEQSDT